MIGIDIEFFRIGFYASCIFLIGSAFFCMRTQFLTHKNRFILVIAVFAIGGVIAAVSVFGGLGPLPTNYWPANFLIVPAAAGIGFLVIAFIRQMAGKDKIVSTRQIGRLMLHLGLIVLLLGVFMSENVVYESNAGYLENDINEIAPNILIEVEDINLQYFNHDRDFNLIVTVKVLENRTQPGGTWSLFIIGVGHCVITGHPDWNMVSHKVHLDKTAFRDVFIAATGFATIIPGTYQVTIHTKILPFVSFVWIGVFLMVAAMLPIFGIEVQALLKSLKGKEKHLYEDGPEDSEDVTTEVQGN
jgi:cytochrome c biogenesis factor